MKDHKPNLNKPELSNSGEKKDWLYFDRSYVFSWKGVPRLHCRVGLASELWYKTYTSAKTSDVSRVYRIIGAEIEEDQKDPSLKLLTLTILGFTVSFGVI